MKAQFKAESPNEIEMTLTITMPVGEWRALAKVIDSAYPGWQFLGVIRDLILQAEAHFFPHEEA